jgi:leucyl/phenylalanyl-tRNA--protein transferase
VEFLRRFPDVCNADPETGLLAVGGDLEVDTLLEAYSSGIFPWPMEGYPLTWFSPQRRAVLFYDEIHISKSLGKFLKTTSYETTQNRDFDAVIRACGESPRPNQTGTWITPEMLKAYRKLHQLGHAQSIEVWEDERGSRKLIAGIYGVDVGGVFSAESMFHKKTNASKLALLTLCKFDQMKGRTFLDVQVMTPHLKALGAREIDRTEFLGALDDYDETNSTSRTNGD